MKYYIVNTTVIDGEFEYLFQSPVKAENREEADRICRAGMEEWTANDERIVKGDSHPSEITEAEYLIISKYIF